MRIGSHIVAQAEWSDSSLQASLRVALQVTQRNDRATASNRYSVRDGHRMMIHSRVVAHRGGVLRLRRAFEAPLG
jgi:hypothetical protein